MNKSLPDKHIRKAIFDLIDAIDVDGETIYCYDTRVTGELDPDFYVIMSTQSNIVDKSSKCGHNWDSDILLDVRAVYRLPGNVGSRLLVDNILDAVRDLVKDIELDVLSGLTITRRTLDFPNDLNEVNESEIIYRKFLRLTLFIQ